MLLAPALGGLLCHSRHNACVNVSLAFLITYPPLADKDEDAIKHQAPNTAWRYGGDEYINYTTFAKPSRSYVGNNVVKEEEILGQAASFWYLIRTLDTDIVADYSQPTDEMETSRTATVIDKESTAQSIPESKHNTHEGHVPRRRLKFMEMLGHPDRINTSETQKHKKDITVWNHHKAVLFEFWLENLFMCVPAVERVYPNAITLGIASFIVGHALSPSLPNTSRLIGTSKVSKVSRHVFQSISS